MYSVLRQKWDDGCRSYLAFSLDANFHFISHVNTKKRENSEGSNLGELFFLLFMSLCHLLIKHCCKILEMLKKIGPCKCLNLTLEKV